MSTLGADDLQNLIDRLFQKLEQAKTGADITQTMHALRIHITNKSNLGRALSAREADVVAAVGAVTSRRRSNPLAKLALLVVLGALAYAAYRWL